MVVEHDFRIKLSIHTREDISCLAVFPMGKETVPKTEISMHKSFAGKNSSFRLDMYAWTDLSLNFRRISDAEYGLHLFEDQSSRLI